MGKGDNGGVMSGKTAVVMGVANEWSIAWAIAKAMAGAGASLAVTCLDERAKRATDALAAKLPGTRVYQVNVEADEELDAFAATLKSDLGQVDALVHAIAYAPAAELKGRFLETSRDGFRLSHSISVYSLIAAAQRVVPLMTDGGSITTLTYLGSERVFPKYNVMGVAKAALEASVRYLAADLGEQRIRVNAISAGPISTASARGIPGFSTMRESLEDRMPMASAFTADQVGSTAVFLASDGAAAITGETLFVDGGYHVMGM
ncbi:MAG: Enoyl-[acyl-carrier-protein] reductase [NADH] [uncultured Thermomicrobiales bacterium]|uniref:Enoyl-[acyl-carrier-protein] reductase [NADH] n=1 Tax=uncultured Thermomicrobiales bacterium TaxID=1645740 RepID=A0A6J4V1Y4_9BACT|nr:MAG: Enoyl-[acyl-carrier-protein] reductase [NADH] [uncultured Thermomicrobiales bacterium]